MPSPYIALTDRRWFDHLRIRSVDGRLDEANFWLPKAQEMPARLAPGDPFFLRLKSPFNVIAGYGYFASFRVLRLQDAWTMFGDRNGDPTWAGFHARIRGYRVGKMDEAEVDTRPLGCVALLHLNLWPEQLWIPWGEERDWKPNIQQGQYERNSANLEVLHSAMAADTIEGPAELVAPFTLVDADERAFVQAQTAVREGQGSFRARLLDAYGGSCAISGEHTEPVFAAAHIQPYLGPRSNHVQNGCCSRRSSTRSTTVGMSPWRRTTSRCT
jgi:putative restriction endonuclease